MQTGSNADLTGQPPSVELRTSGRFTAASSKVGERTRFQPGNPGQWRHGLRSARAAAALLPGQEAIRAAMLERRAAVVADLGGPDELSQVASDEIDRYARLHVLHESLWREIEARGVLTAKGRQRAALTALLAVSDRIDRLAARLGLARRPKHANVATTLARLHDDAPEVTNGPR